MRPPLILLRRLLFLTLGLSPLAAAAADRQALAAEPGPSAQAAEPDPGQGTTPESGRQIQGTRLLFLRLAMRTKRVEQDLLDAPPEALLQHLAVAADLLAQLRRQPLTDDESLRADRAEQYLQRLVEQYSERQRPPQPAE
jgi:hypothetical protein